MVYATSKPPYSGYTQPGPYSGSYLTPYQDPRLTPQAPTPHLNALHIWQAMQQGTEWLYMAKEMLMLAKAFKIPVTNGQDLLIKAQTGDMKAADQLAASLREMLTTRYYDDQQQKAGVVTLTNLAYQYEQEWREHQHTIQAQKAPPAMPEPETPHEDPLTGDHHDDGNFDDAGPT
jgi:hypothetical protein